MGQTFDLWSPSQLKQTIGCLYLRESNICQKSIFLFLNKFILACITVKKFILACSTGTSLTKFVLACTLQRFLNKIDYNPFNMVKLQHHQSLMTKLMYSPFLPWKIHGTSLIILVVHAKRVTKQLVISKYKVFQLRPNH